MCTTPSGGCLRRNTGDAKNGGRAQQQARSARVAFPDKSTASGGNSSFAVDAVPAVQDDQRWAIPTKDRNRWPPA